MLSLVLRPCTFFSNGWEHPSAPDVGGVICRATSSSLTAIPGDTSNEGLRKKTAVNFEKLAAWLKSNGATIDKRLFATDLAVRG